MTVAEFLDWNDGTETRYELIDGRPVAMAPSAPGHSIVVLNLAHELRARLEAPCYVGNEAAVQHSDRDDTFYEADLVVSRTPVQPGMMAIPDPVVVIEVHSPSTIEHDRGLKAYDYRRIASVQEIVLVASAERRVEVWRRRGAKWQIEDLVGDAALELEAVQVSIPLAAVYANTGAASEQPAPAMPELTTRTLAAAADVIAPDGCEVRILASTVRGSMAHFTLLPGQVSRAVVHRTVEELRGRPDVAPAGRSGRDHPGRAWGVARDPDRDPVPAAQRRRRAARRGRGHHAALAGRGRSTLGRGVVAAHRRLTPLNRGPQGAWRLPACR